MTNDATSPALGLVMRPSDETARHLAAAVDASDDAIVCSTPDGVVTAWNPGAERLFGYTAAEMIGYPIARLVPAERRDDLVLIADRPRRRAQATRFETVWVRRDDTHVDVAVTALPLVDADGRLGDVSLIARDISERKREEQERAVRARHQAAMIALRQQALDLANPDVLLDMAAQIVVGALDVDVCVVLELQPGDPAPRLRAGAGLPRESHEQTASRLEGLARYTLASSEPIVVADLAAESRFPALAIAGATSAACVMMGDHAHPFGVLAIISTRPRQFSADDVYFLRAVADLLTTVSVRSRAEEELRMSERRYRAIFEQAPVGLLLYDRTGLQIDANRAGLDNLPAERSAGYNVLADPWLEKTGMLAMIRRAFDGEAVRLPPLNLGQSPYEGTRRWVQGSLYPIVDQAGVVREVVAMVEDISVHVRAQEELEQRVAERTQELSMLLEVSNHVVSTLEIEPVLALILDHLRTVVDYTGATIYMVEGAKLIPLGYRGPLARDQIMNLHIAVAQAVGFQAVRRRGGPVIVDDLWGDAPLARAMHEGDVAPLYAITAYARSYMAVPLMVKERIIGEVVIDHESPGFFSAHHANLVLAFANHAAVAIENARLYAGAQRIAAVEERARLARELHDSVTQMLFSASLIADVLPRLWDRDEAEGRACLDELQLLTRGALAEMRMLLLELRPAALTEANLGDVLRQLTDATASRRRLAISLAVEGRRALPPDVQIALYRIAQESLNNVVKHAGARNVTVNLRYGRRDVEMSIRDDGRGFDAATIGPHHFGQHIMRERAEAVGATLTIDSIPGHGTSVTALWRDHGSGRAHSRPDRRRS